MLSVRAYGSRRKTKPFFLFQLDFFVLGGSVNPLELETDSVLFVEDLAMLEVAEKDGVAVVRIEEEKLLHQEVIDALRNELLELLDKRGFNQFVLSLERVGLGGNMMLDTLVCFSLELKKRQGSIVLCELSPLLRQVFQITEADKLFCICGTEEEGLRALKSGAMA